MRSAAILSIHVMNLLCYWIRNLDLVSIGFRIHSAFTNFHYGERILKVADSYSIQGIPLFREHLPWSQGCPLNKNSVVKRS